jgi:hypothetical protein
VELKNAGGTFGWCILPGGRAKRMSSVEKSKKSTNNVKYPLALRQWGGG